ncbi:MAG TPA: hypothetical protein VGO92_03425 [Acidimicrobiales bacterium]|jgi:hypothetical protein|nr:hypothetical protein [Acidimicrobiales bacterium]
MSKRVLLVSLAAFAAAALALPQAQAAGPELLPNTSFEQGTSPVGPQSTAAGGIDQPLVPVGWAFEGAAGLFDHSAADHHGPGRYQAAISAPASGKNRVCYDQPVGCKPLDPVVTAKNAAADKAASVSPAWRPQAALRVSAGANYTVSGWFAWQLASVGDGGALVRVRWLDANGVGLGASTAVSRVATDRDTGDLNWTFFSATVKAPAGATQAVPLFGALDDAFITQLRYDEVSFKAA